MGVFIFIFILTILLDNLLPIFLARYYSNYNYKYMPLSVLGCNQSPVKWIYNIWCIFSGLVFCYLGYLIINIFDGFISAIIAILLFIYGIGCEIISGIFPLNEKREDETIYTKIHGGCSAIGFIALLFVPLFIALFTNGFWNIVSLFCFILAFIFFVFFIIGEKEKFKNTIFSYCGLWQRLILFICYIPILCFIINMSF